MGVTWTKDQQKVIDLRDRNILVSAAAGSGKTAVLVERIIQRITRDDKKTDIDKLLIVTFTNAAAAEMRERIRDAIEKELEQKPMDTHLQRQYTLVHNAQITTIDSFCLYVIRNYFHKIDLEPNFRVADEGELSLLRSDVLEKVMESYYEKADENFLQFIAGYGSAKNDNAIRDMVLKMYTYAQSYPWPLEWLDSCHEVYQITDVERMCKTPWLTHLLKTLKNMVMDLKSNMEEALHLCALDGPYMYTEAIQEDISMLDAIAQARDYQEMSRHINAYVNAFPKLAAARKFEGSIEKKEQVMEIRGEMKKVIKDIRDKYFYKAPEELFADMRNTSPMADMLIELTKCFANAFEVEKRNKNLVDFSDMEHFALKILVDENTKEPTDTADAFAELFEEVMIDEYQDSNYVQETILKAVSKERFGKNNMFMVGDVKQSIYRFRLARPELFMDKFDHYETTDAPCQRIDLQKNFRSRNEVLEGVNDIFYKIMCRDLGNVVYDAAAALYPGAAYPQVTEDTCSMEIMIADESTVEISDEMDMSDEGEDLRREELEAHMIAQKIKDLVNNQRVTDKKTGELRSCTYQDIVILLRSVSGYADTFVKILMEEGIPAFTPSKTGYFSTVEIQTILNMLNVIDNPMQDIPLAAVLHSPIGGFTGEELAKIKATEKDNNFYDCIFSYVKEEDDTVIKDEELRIRLDEFLKKLQSFRDRVFYTPVHELIDLILTETGYLDYLTALPAGEQKRANVLMLIERAIHYEDTSYKGLFHFVRYIEKLHKYDVDYGEADVVNENENAIRIMSIHKSKGLEFPVVIAAGMGKSFNMQDTKSRLILHPDMGIGMDYMDATKRTKTPTLLKKALAKQTDEENKGEELRVLYVALTRAKEKLILTGCLKDPMEDLKKYKSQSQEEATLSFLKRQSAMKYFDWVMPAVYSYGEKYKITVVQRNDLLKEKIQETARTILEKEQFLHLVCIKNDEISKKIEKRLSYVYPFAKEKDIRTKVSVSDIKHEKMHFEEEELQTVEWYKEEEVKDIIPDFIKNRESGSLESAQNYATVNQGALRGSAVHLVMQCLPFSEYKSGTGEDSWLRGEMLRLKEAGRLEPNMYELVKPNMIDAFFQSDLAKRMIAADRDGKLFKEKAFVMGIPAGEIWDCDSEELVLVQGIVDAFFYENDEIVIMDYKTDSVQKKEQLIGRYQAQLDLYAKALSEATGKKVKEKIIYSFHLKQEITL